MDCPAVRRSRLLCGGGVNTEEAEAVMLHVQTLLEQSAELLLLVQEHVDERFGDRGSLLRLVRGGDDAD